MRTGVKWGFPGGSNSKEFSCSAGDPGSIPGSGRCPGGGHGNPLQYSCLENPMDRGTWWVAVHRVTELDMTEATKHAKGPGRWRDRPARLDTGKRRWRVKSHLKEILPSCVELTKQCVVHAIWLFMRILKSRLLYKSFWFFQLRVGQTRHTCRPWSGSLPSLIHWAQKSHSLYLGEVECCLLWEGFIG